MAQNEDTKKTVIAHPIPDARETVFADGPRPTPGAGAARPVDSGHTQVIFGSPTRPQAPPPPASDSAATAPQAGFLPQGPVVGWLVIVSGAGRGCAKEIYVGRNTVGRDAHNRIPIDFGDPAISREKAAFVIYDPIDNSFTIAPSDGTNIPRRNNAGVHGPQTMAPGDILTIGHTELRFVPLCGPDFQWEQA